MRLAIVDKDRCKVKDCTQECRRFCPIVRTGSDAVVFPVEGKPPVIVEELCTGCGICVKKCPFNAITIINLPEELDSDTSHRYGANSFKLFRLPIPKPQKVLGLVGPNGVGKSTAMKILAGEIKPNLGKFDDPPDWDEIIRYYRGSELQPFFEKMRDGKIKAIFKPQNITDLPKLPSIAEATVGQLLEKVNTSGRLDEVKDMLTLDKIWNRKIKHLSGGELQRIAIAAAIVREGDIYLFDEPTAYLDVAERLKTGKAIRKLAEKGKTVVVVEHDLSILDYVSDYVSIFYGKPSVYGIVSNPHGTRVGINIYLDGFLPDENIRFRDTKIYFHHGSGAGTDFSAQEVLLEYGEMEKHFEKFKLKISPGRVHKGEIIGILGPNGIGKTTFVKILAGVLAPDKGDSPISKEEEEKLKVSYKPQYLKADFDGTVRMFLAKIGGEYASTADFQTTVIKRLELDKLMERPVPELSGGELQRVAIAGCLARDADLYLLDEPSAFLDVEQRLEAARAIRKVIQSRFAAAFIVEHSMITADYISDSLVVFDGTPGVEGHASSVLPLKVGMNKFLKDMGVTFRRDPQTGRPRINKEGSQMDTQQKATGQYYFVDTKSKK